MIAQFKDLLAGHTVATPVPVLLVMLDRTQARFFVDDAEGLRELPSTEADWMRGGRFHEGRDHSPGVGEKRYHHIQQEHHRRHYQAVAQHLRICLKDQRVIGVILGGEHRTLAEFRAALPSDLEKVVLNTLAMSPNALDKRAMRQESEAARHFMK